MVLGTEHFKVKDLWKENSITWNDELIDQMFNEQEASVIKQMPCFNVEEDDHMFWGRSSMGMYTIRSTYYLIMKELMDSAHLCVGGEWMSIWKLKVPQKIKILLWRAAMGVLPTRCNLLRRRVDCENHCPMCEGNPENEWHIFFDCHHAENVWGAGGLLREVQRERDEAEGFSECLFKLLQSLSETKLEKFVMMVWVIWGRHNERVWGGTMQSADHVVNKAMDFLLEWKRSKLSTHGALRHAVQLTTRDIQWQKPSVGQF